MIISYFCLVIAILIPIFCAGYSKFASPRYNNRSPREYIATLEGKAKRAYHAQQNAYEGFAPFAAGVLTAQQMQGPQSLINALAICYILCRMIYTAAYIYDHHVIRSVAWFMGFAATITLFFIGI